MVDLTRQNTQIVIKQIFALKTQLQDNVDVAILPKPTYALPRAKPVPGVKVLTKWEKFSKEKGIQKKKKSKLTWDETTKSWKPLFGYKGVNQTTDQWVIEVPANADPNEDLFEKRSDAKKERIAKNETHRLRNIARASNIKLPGAGGIVPNAELSKDELNKAQRLANVSTASLGKFNKSLPDEKPGKNLGKRRKFESNLDRIGDEKQRSIDLATQILAKQKAPIDDADEEQVLRKTIKGRGKNRRSLKSVDDGDDEIQDKKRVTRSSAGAKKKGSQVKPHRSPGKQSFVKGRGGKKKKH